MNCEIEQIRHIEIIQKKHKTKIQRERAWKWQKQQLISSANYTQSHTWVNTRINKRVYIKNLKVILCQRSSHVCCVQLRLTCIHAGILEICVRVCYFCIFISLCILYKNGHLYPLCVRVCVWHNRPTSNRNTMDCTRSPRACLSARTYTHACSIDT